MIMASALFLLGLLALVRAEEQVPLTGTTNIWEQLKAKVGGRLFEARPFAQSCFIDTMTVPDCRSVELAYENEKARTHHPSAYTWPQWETCQATGEQCLLDYATPSDPAATMPPNTCELGSIPPHYIDVRSEDDVIAAFEFSKTTNIPLVIKNTGHDFSGRSSGKDTLALWTHKLKDISYNAEFVPEGCISASPGVTAGAGVQFYEAFQFAEDNNITLVGGSDASVGFVGGFLQGGGHGVLAPSLGLGADRALQFKIVTPDGKYRTANACQNEDLFFALRGGGGGTFGVVLEATVLAAPVAPVQVIVVNWATKDADTTKALWTLIGENMMRWADEGWGGYSMPELALFVTQRLTKEQATTSMAPLIEFGEKLQRDGVTGAMGMAMEFPSFLPFFNSFMTDAGGNAGAGKVGYNVALTSRLVPRPNFQTPEKRAELVDALLAASSKSPVFIIQITAPTAATITAGRTSMTEAWRDSVYHVTTMLPWNWNATIADQRAHYKTASAAMDHVRAITPDAAYLNEADVHEPNHEVSFWGDHYHELVAIKMKYDPERLLDCWQCVGWDSESSRYSCYL